MMAIVFSLLILLQTTGSNAAPEMTTGGWIFMGGAWAGILSLVYFTFSKILRNAKK